MEQLQLVVVDCVVIAVLTLGVYFPRHHRRDLVVAFLGLNVGVLAVATVLGTVNVGAGLGLGLFGVLSIIRLRSDEIAQHEVAYYFAALALGLVAGMSTAPTGKVLALMALVVATLYLGDHPRLFRRYRQLTVRLDAAYPDGRVLRARVETLFGARVVNLSVRSIDLVNDTTLVEVRYRVPAGRPVHRDAGQPVRAELERVGLP